MGKPNQAGKCHNYPKQHRGYSTSHTGIGGRKKKKEEKHQAEKPTYFDLLKRKQTLNKV